MRYHPPFDEFVRLASQGNLVPVYRQLTGDTLTPVSAFCKIQEGDWAFLFESVVAGERLGRYSFLGAGPFLRFQAHGHRVHVASQPPGGGPAAVVEAEHPAPLRLLEENDAACHRVDRLVERLQQGVADLQLTDVAPVGEITLPYRSNFEPEDFEAAVARCKEYIKAGDIFQVVLSQRLQTETRARAFDIYRTLRVVNPSPFMFYLRTGPTSLVGSSPEIMVRVEGDEVTIRPLAGTRRRGRTEEEDRGLADELLADPKERAEHIMLVDLGRNDVGRVAAYGSVRLRDVMTVER